MKLATEKEVHAINNIWSLKYLWKYIYLYILNIYLTKICNNIKEITQIHPNIINNIEFFKTSHLNWYSVYGVAIVSKTVKEVV